MYMEYKKQIKNLLNKLDIKYRNEDLEKRYTYKISDRIFYKIPFMYFDIKDISFDIYIVFFINGSITIRNFAKYKEKIAITKFPEEYKSYSVYNFNSKRDIKRLKEDIKNIKENIEKIYDIYSKDPFNYILDIHHKQAEHYTITPKSIEEIELYKKLETTLNIMKIIDRYQSLNELRDAVGTASLNFSLSTKDIYKLIRNNLAKVSQHKEDLSNITKYKITEKGKKYIETKG